MQSFIRLLYSLLIAVAMVVFVGVGIYSFYQPPKSPDYPDYPSTYLQPGDTGYEAQQAKYDKANDEYEKLSKGHQAVEKDYYRDVSIIALVATATFSIIGILFLNKWDAVGEGIALGGVAIAIYTITVASMADNRIMRFLGVTAFLATALALTHRKFVAKPRTR